MPVISDKFIREYEELVRTVKNISGPGVEVHWGRGITIGRKRKRWSAGVAGSGAPAEIMLVTQGSSLDNPNLVRAAPYDGSLWTELGSPTATSSDAWVSCVVAHTVSDVILVTEPTGGTGQTIPDTLDEPVTWRELGVFGQEFIVRLDADGGDLGPTVSKTYTVSAISQQYAHDGDIIAEELTPVHRPFLGRITAAATEGRARFYLHTIGLDEQIIKVELVEAFETHGKSARDCPEP